MGNCVSIDLSSLCICCYDRTAAEVMYIWEFKDNLEDLKSSRDGLRACRGDLNTKLQNQEGPQMKPLQTVQLWLDSVDNKLADVDDLIRQGDKEIKDNMCLGGCCYKNSISTYSLGRSFVDSKVQLDDLIKQSKEFRESLVTRVPDEPDHIRDLRRNAKDLKAAKNNLKAKRDDLMRRVRREEGGQQKQLETVRVWFTRVDSLITGVDELIHDVPQVIANWSERDYSKGGFGEQVAQKLIYVNSLIDEGAFPRVVEKVTAESEYISQVKEELEALRRAKDELWGLRADVTRRVEIEKSKQKQPWKQVEVWLQNAAATIAEVDCLLEAASQEVNKLHQVDSCSNFGEKVTKKLKDVLELKKAGEFPEVADTALPEKVVELDCEQTVVGLQKKIDDAWGLLMNKDVGIVGLYGLGGVGKTTLLTHINNKFLDIQSDFDFVIWVTVSKDFTLSEIQEKIADRIGISDSDWKKKNIEEKAKDIRNILRRKKFVLLLDDVWEKLHLEKAGVPVPNRRNGSKIVLSTRSELVCSLMDTRKNKFKVETLPLDQAWQLFKEYVGDLDPTIEPLAKQVAEECDGLPLALIVVARAMECCTESVEWTYALNDLRQSVSNLQGIKEVLYARLKISYDKLPHNKYRSCFIYCALFPEDFKIYKDDLVDYWISEEFEDHEDDKSINRSVAHHIISYLVHVCLLEEEGNYVKMHDVIRDMALWISCEVEKPKYNFLVQAGKQLNKAPEVEKWKGVKRASLMKNALRNLPEVSVCPNLRTLLLCSNPRLNEISASIFHCWRALTVLDLSNTRVQELPLGISEVDSLQHLNLSHTWIEKLPLQLKRLTKLKYLNLEHNEFLGMIPMEVISSFPSLQVLRMFRCGFFYGGAEDNLLSDSNVHIGEMQHLEHLNVVSITIRSADALQLYFRDMQNVQSCTQALSLECFSGSTTLEFLPKEAMEKLETLQISASEDLEQINFKPKFLREKLCFKGLREVCVEYCCKLSNLSWLILAPNLALLKVSVCGNMRDIINDGKCSEVSNVEPFRKLEVVTLEDLPQLKSIHWNSSLFPALKRMRIIDCPMLKKLPLKSDSDSGIKGRKIVIEAEEKWWSILEWENQDTKAAFSFRNCHPRSRICRAAHHFFDLWK